MERILEGPEGDSEILVSQTVPLKEMRSHIWILPGHLTPAQCSVLTSLSPKGMGVLKGPGSCRLKGKNGECVRVGVAKVRRRGGTIIRRRGPDGGAGSGYARTRRSHSLVSTAPTASVQTSTPGAHFTVFIFCGEHPSSAFCTQL